MLPAAADRPVLPASSDPHAPPPHILNEARVGARWTTAMALASAGLLGLAGMSMPVVVGIVLALAAAGLSVARLVRWNGEHERRLPTLAGANALVGLTLFAVPLMLGLRGQFALVPLHFGFLIALFSAAAFVLSFDARPAHAGSAAKHAGRSTKRPSRARPGG